MTIMQGAALLVLLSLIGPTMTSAVCDMTCTSTHQADRATTNNECHRGAGDRTPAVSGTDLCHQQTDELMAAVAVLVRSFAAAATVHMPPAVAAEATALVASSATPRFSCPIISSGPTPLRI